MQPPPVPGQVAQSGPRGIPTEPPTTCGIAVTAMVLGIVGTILALILFLLGFLTVPNMVMIGVGCGLTALVALMAVIFGHISSNGISNPLKNLKGSGMASTGLGLGYLGMFGALGAGFFLYSVGKTNEDGTKMAGAPTESVSSSKVGASPAEPADLLTPKVATNTTAAGAPAPAQTTAAAAPPNSQLAKDTSLLEAVALGLKNYRKEYDVWPADQEDFSRFEGSFADEAILARIRAMKYTAPLEGSDTGIILTLESEGGVTLTADTEGKVEKK